MTDDADDEPDPWGGFKQYWCDWCGSIQLVPPEGQNARYGGGEPLTAGKKWVCVTCYETDPAPWPDEWTERKAAIRRVR